MNLTIIFIDPKSEPPTGFSNCAKCVQIEVVFVRCECKVCSMHKDVIIKYSID